jgi:hypothetical protein
VHIDLDNPVISCVAKLSKLLEAIDEENNDDEIIERSLRNLIKNAIDTFDIASEKTTKEVKDLNDYLNKSNKDMIDEITDFVRNNSGPNVTKKSIRECVNTLNDFTNWNYDNSTRNEDIKISNDTMYNITNFYKTFIENFVSVFPNIVLNKVDYDKINIPSYYGFAKDHNNKLERNISKYFSLLKPFYGINTLNNILSNIQSNGKNAIKLADSTPCFSTIKIGDRILRGVIDERTSRYLFEFYFLRVLINYIQLADQDSMIVTEVKQPLNVTDLFSVEYIEDTETRVDLTMSSRSVMDTRIVMGNKRELKQKTAELLIAFIDMFRNEKDLIDITYEDIQDKIFKLKTKEKDMITDRLKALTDEERDIDTILKITKQGDYSKGLQKGLTIYDKDFYEKEQTFRDEMEKAERKIRNKNKDATDDNIDILLDEYLEQRQAGDEIDNDAFDMSHLGENYYDGYFDGVDAPEEEYEDYADFDS